MTVTVADVLDFIVSRSAAPSNFGAQLDRLKYGIQITPDPFRARDELETSLINTAQLIRCIEDFSSRQEFSVTSRQRTAASPGYKVLEKLQMESQKPQGVIAIGVLRAYQERSGHSQERGLLEVYNYLASFAPETAPRPKGNEDLLMGFRNGTAKRARNMACEAYADALLALQNHCRIWNKQVKV